MLYNLSHCFAVPVSSNRTLHIFCHYTTKQEKDLQQYTHNYMNKRMDYFEQVGERFLNKIGMTSDDYANRLLLEDTPLDMLGIFILARLYRIHVGVIMHGGVWSTSRTNDVRLQNLS